MEPRDAVKLIYQNEFGGGHLIRDESACLDFLRREYESVSQLPDLPLLDEIGSEIVRVNLAALDACGYLVDALGNSFLLSAAAHRLPFCPVEYRKSAELPMHGSDWRWD